MQRAMVKVSGKLVQEFRESKAVALCMKDVHVHARAHTTPLG